MNRLIVNFKSVEATSANLMHSVSVAQKYIKKHPDATRVTVTWNSPEELYAYQGKRHWNDGIMFFEVKEEIRE